METVLPIQDVAMNTPQHPLPRHRSTQGAGSGAWAHTLIWVLLAIAALLLVGFIAVVNDITERGELRRVQQRTSGTFAPDRLPTDSVDVARLLSMTGEKLAGR